MKNTIKGKVILALSFLTLFSIITANAFIRSNLVWHSNYNRYIDRKHNQTINIKSDSKFSYKGKNYRIIFGNSESKEDDLYLQCFKEKLNGLFLQPTYGASQGESKSLYGLTKHFVSEKGTNDGFVVVYGYNKDFKAKNFSVKKLNDNEWITQDISKQEYFLYNYENIVYPEIVFKDKLGHDITRNFYRQ